MEISLLLNIGIMICIVAVVTYIMRVLKQPLIFGYVLGGVLLGPAIFNFISDTNIILGISELGIAFMLFIIGMELDFKNLKYLGKDILIASLIQLVFVSGVTFALTFFFHISLREAIIISIITFFSSTLLVAKWLDDNKTADTLFGKLTIGSLLLQDLIAIAALSLLTAQGNFSILAVAFAVLKGIFLIVLVFVLTKLLFKPLNFASKEPDLLFIISLALCFSFIFIALAFGYSMSVGAFLAGLVIANFPYKLDLHHKIRTLSTFFNVLFLAGLGMFITFNYSPQMLIFIAILLGVVHLLKPIIIFLSFRAVGYDSKVSFLTGINLAQTSEFGLCIAIAAFAASLMSLNIFGLIVLFTILTMLISSYLIKYDISIYYAIKPFLSLFDGMFKSKNKEDKYHHEQYTPDVLVVGSDDIDPGLLTKFKMLNKSTLIIANDPHQHQLLQKQGFACIYGSGDNHDILEKIDFKKVSILISTVKDKFENLTLMRKLKAESKKAIAIQYARDITDAAELYEAGTDYVIYPTLLGEDKVSVLIEDYEKDINSILTKKILEQEKLKRKQEQQRKKAEDLSFMLDIDKFVKNIQLKKEQQDNDAKPEVVVYDTEIMTPVQDKEQAQPSGGAHPA